MKGLDPYGASKAIRPWDGTSLFGCESKAKKGRKPTPEYFEEVRGCLSCTLPPSACNECKGPQKTRELKRRKDIIRALKSGDKTQEVAKRFGVTTRAIRYYEKKYADQINDPCVECKTTSICKAMGKVCVKKERWMNE